jgi:hypothetical protein
MILQSVHITSSQKASQDHQRREQTPKPGLHTVQVQDTRMTFYYGNLEDSQIREDSFIYRTTDLRLLPTASSTHNLVAEPYQPTYQ